MNSKVVFFLDGFLPYEIDSVLPPRIIKCARYLSFTDPVGLEFPGGKWAIPGHKSGCPDDTFLTGSRTQVNDGK